MLINPSESAIFSKLSPKLHLLIYCIIKIHKQYKGLGVSIVRALQAP